MKYKMNDTNFRHIPVQETIAGSALYELQCLPEKGFLEAQELNE
jgi:hypothetical protein